MCAGAKLRQKQSLVVEPAAPLEIHVDEELAQQPARRTPKADADTTAAPSLRLRLDAPDLEEHLQHDPLRLHKVCLCFGHACSSMFTAECITAKSACRTVCWPSRKSDVS